MGRLFAQIDVHLPDDARVIEAGPMAELAYIRCVLRAREHLTDGVIDRRVVARWLAGLRGKPEALMARLVAVDLLESHPDGWCIPFAKWQKWNPTRAEVEKKRADEVERVRAYRERNRAVRTDVVRDVYETPEPEPEPEPEKTPLPPIDAQPALSTASEEEEGMNAEQQRIAAAAFAYARLVLAHTTDVRSPNAFANATIAKVMTREHPDPRVTVPEIVHYVRLFPDAPPGDIALWLDGNKGTMCRYRRADEMPDAPETPFLAPYVDAAPREVAQ